MRYTDYVSNPKSDKWNDPLYKVSVTYRWTHKTSHKTGTRLIRVKSLSCAQEIIRYWNMPIHGDTYTYEIIESTTDADMRMYPSWQWYRPE